MKFISKYVAPWVLPNQPFPVHCVWEPDKALSKISIQVPEKYRLTDMLNFNIFDANDKTYEMIIKAENLKSNNYFGVILKYPGTDFEIEKRDNITINFLDSQQKVLETIILQTRIIRPKLEIIDYPKEIVVNDNSNPKNLIKLEILHKGFGTANLNISVLHSGFDISKTDSLYFQVLKETILKIMSICDQPNDSQAPIEIEDEFTRVVAENLFKSELQEDLPFKLDKEQVEKLKQIINDKSKQEAIYRTIYASLRPLLLTALLYYSEKHPEEDIKLVDGKVVATIKDRVEDLTVIIKYMDSCENEYEPLVARINVLDKRSIGKIRDFDIPINLFWKKDILTLEGA